MPVQVSQLHRNTICTTVKCPQCKRGIVLWEVAINGEATFSIDDSGLVYPEAVCMNIRGKGYCSFAGFIKIKRYRVRRDE